MLTRQSVYHQYHGNHSRTCAPPHHVFGHPHQMGTAQARRYAGGGLEGGAVVLVGLKSTPMVGGWGYLGMDPSDPLTWPRPFNPQPGMIGWLNGQAR